MASVGDSKSAVGHSGRVVYRSGPENRDVTKPSTRVLMALDSLPEYDMEDAETVVYDHVDLDALDALFQPTDGNRSGQVTFRIDPYEVTVTAAGEITIETKP